MATTTKGSILVTGANGGLGSAIVESIASSSELSSYHGLYAVRNAAHAPSLTSALAHSAKHSHDIVGLDLTKLDAVRKTAERINARIAAREIPPIRALVLNAGFQDFGKQSWTEDNLDTTFVANYLGHWLLTLLLLQSMDKEAGRIIVIGSQNHDPEDPRNDPTKAFEDPKFRTIVPDAARFEAIAKGTWNPASEDPSWQGGQRRYGASKFFLITMQHELQARLNTDPVLSKICIVGVDPGTMVTNITRNAPWFIRVLMFKIIFPVLLYMSPNSEMVRATSRSAGDVLEAAFGEGDEPPKDKYYYTRKPFETAKETRDPAKREIVWKETVKLAHFQKGDTLLTNWQ